MSGMKLDADRQGFLVGVPLSDAEAVRILGKIKGDTGRILALLGGKTRPTGPAAVPSARASRTAVAAAAAASAVRRPGVAATPAGRSRDAASGRFVASPRVDRAMTDVAAATETLARAAQAQRRDAKADAAVARAAGQARDARGRFGAGAGEGASRGLFGGRLAGLSGGAGAAMEGAERVDPLVAAFGEARAAVAPIGRAGSMLFGRGDDDSGGWLRKMWRELRIMRIGGAKADRDMLRELKDGGAAGAAQSGGLLGSMLDAGGRVLPAIMSVLGGVFRTVLGPVAAAIGGWQLGKWIGGKVYDWLDRSGLLTKVFDGIDSIKEAVGSLWDGAKKTWNMVSDGAVNAARTAGALVSSGVDRVSGWVSKVFESGSGGPGTISSGRGDFGGKSYGTHQLSSKAGTLQRFLMTSGYGSQFAGMQPGSAAFDAQWKRLAAGDPAFASAQHAFMRQTHVDPMMRRLSAAGMDLSGRGEAVREAIFSTATQFGPGSSVVQRALAGRNVASLSDAQIVSAIQDYKLANNDSLFRSSDANTRAGTLSRAAREKQLLLSLAGQGVSSPQALALPTMPTMPLVMSAPPVPAIELSSPRPAGPPPAPTPAASPGVGQDVRDRTIAHIVTGGIGGSIALRG